MKKLSILTTPAIVFGVGVLCAPQALAADYTLSQANINAAAAAAETNVNGIFCADAQNFCTLSEGDWTQEGNIDLTAVEINAGTPINELVLQNNVNISNPDGGTIKGNIGVTANEVTLTDLNLTSDASALTIQNADAEVTIDGGSYTNTGMGGALNVNNAKTVTVNGATFNAGGASAAYIGAGDITINGGSFVSEVDHGIEFYGNPNVSISAGTFSGGVAGLAFDGVPTGTISLTGGTFTGTGANGSAILILGTDDTTAIANMVADGYHFTNGTVVASTDPFDNVHIAATTTKVISDNASDDEESTDPTTPASTKKSGLGAPDTGVYTAEGGSATSSSIVAIMTTVLVALTGAILVKKHSKRA